MKVELSENMENMVERIARITPKEITNMSVDEIRKHSKGVRKKNALFKRIGGSLVPRRHRVEFSKILPRGSMIAANYRFSYREETNKKIMRMK